MTAITTAIHLAALKLIFHRLWTRYRFLLETNYSTVFCVIKNFHFGRFIFHFSWFISSLNLQRVHWNVYLNRLCTTNITYVFILSSLNTSTGYRTMSDKGCFTTDTVVRREVKKSLIDNLLMQFFHISNRTMCLIEKILYQYFLVFFPCLGHLLLWKKFSLSLHSAKNLKKI